MAGVKGAGGPPPKRSDQRRRTNKPAKEPTKAKGAARVPVPRADPKWHPVAKRFFNSLGRSGQAIFYEPSDWAAAYVLAESMSRELAHQPVVVGERVEMHAVPPKAASVAAWLKGMTALLATEGDRRRAALELQRDLGGEPGEPGDDDDVAQFADYRDRLRAS